MHRTRSMVDQCCSSLVLLVAMLPAAALLAAGCGGDVDAGGSSGAADPTATAAAATEAGPPVRGGTLRIGMEAEPGVLNRYVALGGVSDRVVNGIVSDPLVEADPDWKLFPQLATEVPTVANGGVRMVGKRLLVTVGLRPEATWSDGHPFTCSDVQFTFEVMRDPRWLITSKIGWNRLEAVRCPTPKRVEFVFDRPYASFMRVLTDAPLPRHELEGKDFNRYWNDAITVSSGPFVFERWDRGRQIVLRRNERYWKRGEEGLPHLDRIVLEFYRDPNTLDLQLSAGRLDLINRALEANAAEERQVFPRSQYMVTPGTGIEHLGFNMGRKPMSDIDVRRAVAYAVDRSQITDVVLDEPFEVVDSTLLPIQEPYYAASFAKFRPDDQLVREHLERAVTCAPDSGPCLVRVSFPPGGGKGDVDDGEGQAAYGAAGDSQAA